MALIDTLGEIPDPRRGNAQRHELLDILAIALVGFQSHRSAGRRAVWTSPSPLSTGSRSYGNSSA